MAGPHEPSMEDILASIKRVIAEEKEIRAAAPPPLPEQEEDVLELDEGMEIHETPPVPADLGPPLIEEQVADTSRQRLEELANVAATAAVLAKTAWHLTADTLVARMRGFVTRCGLSCFQETEAKWFKPSARSRSCFRPRR